MRSTKRKRTTTISENDEDNSNNLKEIQDKKRLIVGLNENGKLVKQEKSSMLTTTTKASNLLDSPSPSTSSLTSLKENKHVNSDELVTEIITIKSKEECKTTTTTTTKVDGTTTTKTTEQHGETSTAIRKRFKSRKTNLKNLQNKKLSSGSVTKSAFNTIDNILPKCDKITDALTKIPSSPVKVAKPAAEIESIPLPKLTWASNNELWSLMKIKCKKYKHDPGYLRRHIGIEPSMRAVLLDWIMEIAHAYRLHRETFHLAVEYIDRFMSLSSEKHKVDRLQLIGITALFIASKVEEIYPPKLKDFAYHMDDYSTDNETAISEFELYMLKTLNWQISSVTVNTWLNTYLQIKNVVIQSGGACCNTSILLPKELHQDYIKAIALIDLCAFDYDSLKYDYSQIAACAMYYTIKPYDTALISSGFKLNEIQACLNWMSPYAEIIMEYKDKFKLRKFTEIDIDNSHNIQLHFNFMDYMKEAKLRKTPAKQTTLDELSFVLTPPDSNKKKKLTTKRKNCFKYIDIFLIKAKNRIFVNYILLKKKKKIFACLFFKIHLLAFFMGKKKKKKLGREKRKQDFDDYFFILLCVHVRIKLN